MTFSKCVSVTIFKSYPMYPEISQTLSDSVDGTSGSQTLASFWLVPAELTVLAPRIV